MMTSLTAESYLYVKVNEIKPLDLINSDLSVYDRFSDPIKILYQVSVQVPRS